VHLEAACVLVVTQYGPRRFSRLFLAAVAGFAGIVGMVATGLAHGVMPDQFQTRYLLPGFAILATNLSLDAPTSPHQSEGAAFAAPSEDTDAIMARRAFYRTS